MDKDMKTHELKCWKEYFEPILSGLKTFEIRLNDRDYKVGDILILKEFIPETQIYSGRIITCKVSFITDFEQKPNYVVMSIIIIDYTDRFEQ
jgi:ASC-1-like (ASCH) protein